MYGDFDCPECGEKVSARSKSCACGWKSKEKSTFAMACNFNMHGFPCGKKVVISYQNSKKIHVALCEQHYDELRQKSEIELELERRATEIIQQAKFSGMTNREYAEATGFVKIFNEMRKADEPKPDTKPNRYKTIFEFEAERLKENASKTNGKAPRLNDLPSCNTNDAVFTKEAEISLDELLNEDGGEWWV